MEKIKVAIMYDFDKTLSPKDMQEFSFIPSIGIEDPAIFWKEVNDYTVKNKMDPILSYMYIMLRKAEHANQPIRRQDFVSLGKKVELFNGVDTWFKRINEYANQLNIEIEHYIISSGLSEIIEGTSIAKEFKKIYACKYVYNASEVAIWPATVVNFTTKTQYLFRINKGILDESNNVDLNKSMPDDKRPIPFDRMIYIGDGYTDIPAMKLVKQNGGKTIAIYNPSGNDTTTAKDLFNEKRADFIAPSNYEENSPIDEIVKTILQHVEIEYRVKAIAQSSK